MPRATSAASPSWLRANALTVILLSLFAFSLLGQMTTGFQTENAERMEHG